MIKKLFKLIVVAIMLTVCGTLAFRMYTLNSYPDFAKGIIAVDSYKDENLEAITWELPAKYDEAGEFFAYQPIYSKTAKTLTVTIRYNDSLLESLKFENGGEALPLFPSLYADGKGRILPTKYVYGHAFGIYSYRRYVFEDVELSDYEHLYLDIHRDEEYSARPYTTLEIYDSAIPQKEYKLTGKDKNALK